MANSRKFIIADPEKFKRQTMRWAQRFDPVCILDSNGYKEDQYSQFDWIAAIGAKSIIEENTGCAFSSLQSWLDNKKDWAFGFLGYDLKNEIEALSSANHSNIDFPDMAFFIPEILLVLNGDHLEMLTDGPAEKIFDEINEELVDPFKRPADLNWECGISRESYLHQVEKIKEHIAEGECYELNYCLNFTATSDQFDPVDAFMYWNDRANAPMSAFIHLEGLYALSFSPERFMQHRNGSLVSQPMKGTCKRSKHPLSDNALKEGLREDIKERAENVMIVDLVRNDLTRSAVPGTIKVNELFGVYSFPAVHQMISTITAERAPGCHPVDAIRNAFPMGSMTGAPKIRTMKIIDRIENFKRGLYSGAIGYFTPDRNFDFNVCIRTVLFDRRKGKLSYPAGGAITWDSKPEREYEEILLKRSGV